MKTCRSARMLEFETGRNIASENRVVDNETGELRHSRRQGVTMKPVDIIDRGRGPEISGTRVTVYLIWEFYRNGCPRDDIALAVGLSSRQVDAAINYIEAHREEVDREYAKIEARIQQGNPAWVERRLKQNRDKLRQWKADHRDLAKQA